MKFQKSFPVAIAVSLSLVATPGMAQRYSPPNEPPIVAGGSPTGRSGGGASRGTCPLVDTDLTALVPSGQHATPTASSANIVWARSTQSHPTLWFYSPYTLSSDMPAELVLIDKHNNIIYQTMMDHSAAPGILEVPIPASVPPLQLNQGYEWIFSVYCGPENPVVASGWIEGSVLNPELSAQIAEALSPVAKATLYAENGYWHDALAELAAARRANPTNEAIATAWRNLLQSVGLDNLSTAQILQLSSTSTTAHQSQ
ncbi:DUF928 domain-containing protein [Leptolyngbya sp. AN02str]|uniref:DUF928 domain-containing protein n=1 Tax=Leptolyngbya sp. AN02str TaxID=3423363 RepID=UPI003D31ED46